MLPNLARKTRAREPLFGIVSPCFLYRELRFLHHVELFPELEHHLVAKYFAGPTPLKTNFMALNT